MENNFEKNKIIPIERGEEIKIEKLKERADGVYNGTSILMDTILKIEAEKEKQLEEEFKKPDADKNFELIGLLRDNLNEINEIEGDLLKTLEETAKKQDEIREKLIEISEKIEKREF